MTLGTRVILMPELCGYVVLLRVQSGHGYVLPDARCIRESGHIGFHVYDTFTPEACEDERTAHQTTLSDNGTDVRK